MLLSSSLPLSAQGMDKTAARERERRESAVAGPSRVFTDEDLRRYAGERPPEPAGPLPSDQPQTSIDPLAQGVPRQDAYGRHRASAEAYVKQCDERLRAAKETWLAASEAGQSGAEVRARRAVESAARSLEHAMEYRSQAEVAARLAGGLPGGSR
jgi:hypothetical protein